jgi:hypothetical protein
MTLPTYDELVAQVAELTAARAKPLTLDDLPLRDLRSKLIENGDPLDLSVLGLIGQTADFGSAKPTIRWGTATLTWPGGVPVSGAATVPHGFPSNLQPLEAWVSPTNTGSPWCAPQVDVGATNLTITAHTTDGTNPGAGTTATVYWLAIG